MAVKVLMVLDKEFPPDERVEKEIMTLNEKGCNVSVACLTFKNLPFTEHYNGCTIYRKRISGLLYKSSAAILLLPFYFWFWYRFLNNILKKERFDMIHIHDLPLSKTGFLLAKKYKMKLVCDQHEYYSNWIIRTRHYNTLLGRVLKLSPWKAYERKYLRKADLVITVEDSLRDIYIHHVQVTSDHIITLPNTPSYSNFRIENVEPAIKERFAGKFVLFYGGSLDHLRGIDFIMKCLSKLKQDMTDVLFLIAGKENSAFSLNKLIDEWRVQDVVYFAGWVPLPELPSYVAASDVCLFVPKADNLEINNTVATKIYQYAAMGKPVIVSEARKMKEFVEENGIGFSVDFGNVDAFCEIVRKLYNQPALNEQIKERAVRIAQKYTWESTCTDFVHAYQQLAN